MTVNTAPDSPVPDLADLLADNLVAEPPPAASAERIKHRLLRRIADAEIGRHVTVVAEAGRWRDLGAGLSLKVLHHGGDVMSYLLRLAPGSTLPPHRHPLDEECMVLEGEVQIGALRVGAGGFHLGRQGVPHAPIHSAGGALLFLRGAVPDIATLI